MDPKVALVRHFLAALAYRTQKALRGAGRNYADFSAGANVRTPHEIVWHMTGVLGYARTRFIGGVWRPDRMDTFENEVQRFHEILEDLDRLLLEQTPDAPAMENLLQGPLADAMTHAGQLAMLRRMAGSPVPPENFFRANILAGKVGPDQSTPVAPDKDWPDRPKQS